MHDVAAFLVRRDHRLAGEIRDLLEADLVVGSVPELDELSTASTWLDGSTSSAGRERVRRFGQLKIALDAALADWLGDEGRQVSTATNATTRAARMSTESRPTSGSSPVSSTWRARPR